jgi:hypothetical protein
MKFASLILLWAATALAQGDIYRVQTRTSRTAIWVGDQFEYTVRVEHAPGIQFVLDHLKKDEMPVHPFELLGVQTFSGPLAQGKQFFEVRMLLTIYDIAQPEAAIPAFNLFYFRRGQNPNPARDAREATPAELLPVPAFTVSIRSTLTDLGTGIRDQKTALPLRIRTWLLPAVLGLSGIMAILAYLAWLAVARIRSGFWRHKMAERARKKSLSESLQEIRQAPTDSPQEIEAFYRKAAEILRGLAAEKIHGNGHADGMTGEEIEAALKKGATGERQAATMGYLLEQCDLVRYTPGGFDLGRRVHPEFLRRFEELAEHRS